MDEKTMEQRVAAIRMLARAMPRSIADKFELHLTRKLAAATERNRAQRVLELKQSLKQ
jgi:hypothetical protein